MSTEKTIYFIRHGQSVGNATPVFQPLESPLKDLGKKQAEYLAQRISNLTFDTLLSSPLPRAQQTAEAIKNVTGKNIEFSDLFVERIKPTSVSGKSYEDEQACTTSKKWKKSLCTPDMRVEDGENFEDIISRADTALDFLKHRTEKSIVVVTHGYFLRTMIARVLLGNTLSAESFRNFQKSIEHQNTGVTVLQYVVKPEDSGWQLWTYNDHDHLIHKVQNKI